MNEYQQILSSPETEHSLSIDLDWLIGVFEAEGSLITGMNNRGCATFKIDICNTNYKIVDKVASNLDMLGCEYRFENKIRKAHWKPAKAICMDGMKKCERFLIYTQGKWKAKRNQARSSLMLEFIDSRASRRLKDAYTNRELQIIKIMYDLNRK